MAGQRNANERAMFLRIMAMLFLGVIGFLLVNVQIGSQILPSFGHMPSRFSLQVAGPLGGDLVQRVVKENSQALLSKSLHLTWLTECGCTGMEIEAMFLLKGVREFVANLTINKALLIECLVRCVCVCIKKLFWQCTERCEIYPTDIATLIREFESGSDDRISRCKEAMNRIQHCHIFFAVGSLRLHR